MSIFNFQFGDFEDISPNWFDWFSLILNLIVTSLSIYFAYYLGEKTYKRDKDDKAYERKEDISYEKSLFHNNLAELNENISTQISFLDEYIANKDFRLKINPALQTNFLQFLDLKTIYHGVNNPTRINELISTLYSMESITSTLALELTNYITNFNTHEAKFKNYRQAYYKKFYDYSNKRAEEIIEEGGIKKWRYNKNDKFMEEYTKLRSTSITNVDGTANHKLIDINFILPLIELSNKYIPEDYAAIDIHNIANDAHSAYIDMENLTNIHFETIKKYKELLVETKNDITTYLN